MIFYCEECDKTYNTAYLDGYISDRMMQDVLFIIDSKGKCLGVKKDQEEWMKQFNIKHWYERMESHAKTYDIFECIVCGEDIYIQ